MERAFIPVVLLLSLLLVCPATAQDTITGAFQGIVKDSRNGNPIVGAEARIINLQTGISHTRRTDAHGVFYQAQLSPGIYRIEVTMAGFEPRVTEQRLEIGFPGEVMPVPFALEPSGVVTGGPLLVADTDIPSKINRTGAHRNQSFSEDELGKLPLGSITLVRTFDQLAQLAAGVAPPPQTLGSVAGPGQGAGVGSAGQFSVNGLRSRANNFTVDGSDNNDEDIGVRRQGFVSLIPQSIESIEAFQIITLLAPAQYGRNLGAQVNAVSKSGGNDVHGILYGFFNSSQLNARNFFDTERVTFQEDLRSAAGQAVLLDNQPIPVFNRAGGEDSFTFGKFGATLGGPLRREKTFYFLSAEGQIINATQEESFAVPNVEQRGAFRTGASGIHQDPFTGKPIKTTPDSFAGTAPASFTGSAIFSLFPFPNNRDGVYGDNTFTQVLPAHARGQMFSAKLDHNFKLAGRDQTATGRYNYTNDRREIPVTGGALFSTLQPRVRAQNFSFFLKGGLSATGSVLNQLRLSYGRTRLHFREVRDREFLCPSKELPEEQFLLNAPEWRNQTMPDPRGGPNTGPVIYSKVIDAPRCHHQSQTVEDEVGMLGQVIIAGFSPVGADVFNFPQRRVNNTYQIADHINWRAGNHNLTFGVDNRRSELNSDLPRLARPLVTFQGGPRLPVDQNGKLRLPAAGEAVSVVKPEDLAAIGAASGFFLSLATQDLSSGIGLRFYQINAFLQDDWRIRNNFTLGLGLRYEYNTPPREMNQAIERTFDDKFALGHISCPAGVSPDKCGFGPLIDNRERIFDPDRNNFAPRVSLAYSIGRDQATVIRAGYGLFFDQILGAVVSQSRNVFPSFVTVNFGGLDAEDVTNTLVFFNPARTSFVGNRLIQERTTNRLNKGIDLERFLTSLSGRFPDALGLTLPVRGLKMPEAHHYSFSVERKFGSNLAISASYVGTQGRHLLRFTTPNSGPGVTIVPLSFVVNGLNLILLPEVHGQVRSPKRDISGVGAVNLFETSASSRYDALQLEARGRFRSELQYRAAYTFSHANDDVSDVFDLAGASALPQNSQNLGVERGPANFDARHRFTFEASYDLSPLAAGLRSLDWLLEGLQVASVGSFQTGQPFTVNSIFDINLDGNLTDRLNTLDGLLTTFDRRQPLRLITDNTFSLLAPFGQDGRIGRNSFRASGIAVVDVSVVKQLKFAARRISLRVEVFNLFNRANFGIPVRLLEAPAFGQVVNTLMSGRRVQLALKLSF
jgi:hypothetical protein